MKGRTTCSVHGEHARDGIALNDERRDKFLRLLRACNNFDTCARAIGVTPKVARRWYINGGDTSARKHYRMFRRDVDMVEAEAEARNVAIIANAAVDSWQAAAWLLERKSPERWARVSQREKAAEITEPDKPHDPFLEVDELAQRRRSGIG